MTLVVWNGRYITRRQLYAILRRLETHARKVGR